MRGPEARKNLESWMPANFPDRARWEKLADDMDADHAAHNDWFLGNVSIGEAPKPKKRWWQR